MCEVYVIESLPAYQLHEGLMDGQAIVQPGEGRSGTGHKIYN